MYSVGALIGTTEFFSHKPRVFQAVAGEQGCKLLTIPRSGFDKLITQHPQACPQCWQQNAMFASIICCAQAAVGLLTICQRTATLDATQVWVSASAHTGLPDAATLA